MALEDEHEMKGPQPTPEDQRLLTKEHMNNIKKLVVEKIKEASRNGKLAQTPKLENVLNYWKYNGDETEVSTWINDFIKPDSGLADFLELFVGYSTSQTVGDAAASVNYVFYLDSFLRSLTQRA